MRRPTLALAMIVKNEQEFLPGCLKSVMPFVDEAVIVDTGSSDNTLQIAHDTGAKIIEMPWRDDFAEARNVAWVAVTSDWVLQLDADERLAQGSGLVVLSALQRYGDRFEAGLLHLHNAKSLDAPEAGIIAGADRIGEAPQLPRLLRHDPELRYEGRVHEVPQKWYATPGRTIAALNAHIIHYGNVPEIRKRLGKNERNLELLRRRFAENERDLEAAGYLAFALLSTGNHEEAEAVVELAWRHRDTVEQAHAGNRLAAAKCLWHLNRGEVFQVLETAADQSKRTPPIPDMYYLVALALTMAADSNNGARKRQCLEDARGALLQALALKSGPNIEVVLSGDIFAQCQEHLAEVEKELAT